MAITAKMVKELRTMTGAGMMECKNALTESNGDMDTANDILRKRGLKIADKKAGRDADQGLVGIYVDSGRAVIAEVNCETDFVARTEGFQDFVTCILTGGNDDTTEVITKLGENIKVNKIVHMDMASANASVLSTYVHGQLAPNMGSIGVVVLLKGTATEELGKQIAMHIAASNPQSVSVDDLDPEFVANERRLFTEQAVESGKPANIIEKMVEGRMQKALRAVALTEQPFVIDPDTTVGKVLKEADAEVVSFVRLAVGE